MSISWLVTAYLIHTIEMIQPHSSRQLVLVHLNVLFFTKMSFIAVSVMNYATIIENQGVNLRFQDDHS